MARTTYPLPHEPAKMEPMYWDGSGRTVPKSNPARKMKAMHYVGKGYKGLFRCPVCGRETWQHLNFLGCRDLICTFTKITKQ